LDWASMKRTIIFHKYTPFQDLPTL